MFRWFFTKQKPLHYKRWFKRYILCCIKCFSDAHLYNDCYSLSERLAQLVHVRKHLGLICFNDLFLSDSHNIEWLQPSRAPNVASLIRAASFYIPNVISLIRAASFHIPNVTSLIRAASFYIPNVISLIRAASFYIPNVISLIRTASSCAITQFVKKKNPPFHEIGRHAGIDYYFYRTAIIAHFQGFFLLPSLGSENRRK